MHPLRRVGSRRGVRCSTSVLTECGSSSPPVPHGWDAILTLEETTGTLFASDLLAQPGASQATTDGDVVEPALDLLRHHPDVIPVTPGTLSTSERLVALHPTALAIHHGAAYSGDATQALAVLPHRTWLAHEAY